MYKTLSPKPKPESRVIFFGDPTDPELKDTINRVAITGRKVEMQTRPSWDTGMGMCGKHLCSCKVHCGRKVFGVNKTTGKVIL
jgi:hypothetical protein